ncbi:MAG: ABC transporter substrate-binding protein, partial [Paracoccaceae bacterium]|nr:ABC transporter substrate-binding protein [Paracoccaceae bacterium]
MFRKSFLGLAAALAVAGTSVLAQDMIKIGAIAPKTGPLAGGAVVTQWPNVQLWVEQVNARGGLDVGGEKKMIELIEYDDKTNPG